MYVYKLCYKSHVKREINKSQFEKDQINNIIKQKHQML